MGANNDEMFKICLNIFVGIGTVLTQARLQLSGGENSGPYTLSAMLLLFFFFSLLFPFLKMLIGNWLW